MSATDSLHYQLCRKAATFLRNRRNWENTRQMKSCAEDEGWHGPWKWSVVEIVTQATENCDVWATNGYESVVVEVKISRADFLRDRKKWHRRKDKAYYQTGNFRYYLAPEGIINEDDLPEGWGLLEWNGKAIVKRKQSTFRTVSNRSDLMIMCSILRREGILPCTLDYRNANPMGDSLTAWLPAVLRPYTKAIDALYKDIYGDYNVRTIISDFQTGRLELSINGQSTRLSYVEDNGTKYIDTRTLEQKRITFEKK